MEGTHVENAYRRWCELGTHDADRAGSGPRTSEYERSATFVGAWQRSKATAVSWSNILLALYYLRLLLALYRRLLLHRQRELWRPVYTRKRLLQHLGMEDGTDASLLLA